MFEQATKEEICYRDIDLHSFNREFKAQAAFSIFALVANI
jgi:hypothetical protein